MRRQWEVHEGPAKVLRGSNGGCVYKVFGENRRIICEVQRMNMRPEVHAEFRPFGYRASSFSPFPVIFYCPLRILLICLPSSSVIEIITYESRHDTGNGRSKMHPNNYISGIFYILKKKDSWKYIVAVIFSLLLFLPPFLSVSTGQYGVLKLQQGDPLERSKLQFGLKRYLKRHL